MKDPKWTGPPCLILDTEGSTDHIPGVHRIPLYSLLPPQREVDGIWEIIPLNERGVQDDNGNPVEAWSYYEAIEYLKANKDNIPYSHIGIDTLNNFVDWVNEAVLEEIKAVDADSRDPKYQDATDISEIDFGVGTAKSRGKVSSRVVELLNLLTSVGQLVCTVQMENTIAIRAGNQVIPQQRLSGIPDKLSKWLTGHAETICHLQKKIDPNGTVQYTASFDGSGESIMGSRIDALKGKTLSFAKDGPRSLYSQMRALMDAYEAEQPRHPIVDGEGPVQVARPNYKNGFASGTLHLICGQPKSGKSTSLAGWGIYEKPQKQSKAKPHEEAKEIHDDAESPGSQRRV